MNFVMVIATTTSLTIFFQVAFSYDFQRRLPPAATCWRRCILHFALSQVLAVDICRHCFNRGGLDEASFVVGLVAVLKNTATHFLSSSFASPSSFCHV